MPLATAICGYSRVLTVMNLDGLETHKTPAQAGVLAGQDWWAGAGSNRRPSAFQAERRPAITFTLAL